MSNVQSLNAHMCRLVNVAHAICLFASLCCLFIGQGTETKENQLSKAGRKKEKERDRDYNVVTACQRSSRAPANGIKSMLHVH